MPAYIVRLLTVCSHRREPLTVPIRAVNESERRYPGSQEQRIDGQVPLRLRCPLPIKGVVGPPITTKVERTPDAWLMQVTDEGRHGEDVAQPKVADETYAH